MEQILDCALTTLDDGQKVLIEAVKDKECFYIRFYSNYSEDRSRKTASLTDLAIWWLRLIGDRVEVGR